MSGPTALVPRQRPNGQRCDLFAYGTLLPGEERWEYLKPFVCTDGVEVVVNGDLYDTGYGYPAAIFDGDARYTGGSIRGRLFRLRPDRHREALDLLDRVEGAVDGMYRRVSIRIADGSHAWAYQVGGTVPLTPIANGDWRERRAATMRSVGTIGD